MGSFYPGPFGNDPANRLRVNVLAHLERPLLRLEKSRSLRPSEFDEAFAALATYNLLAAGRWFGMNGPLESFAAGETYAFEAPVSEQIDAWEVRLRAYLDEDPDIEASDVPRVRKLLNAELAMLRKHRAAHDRLDAALRARYAAGSRAAKKSARRR